MDPAIHDEIDDTTPETAALDAAESTPEPDTSESSRNSRASRVPTNLDRWLTIGIWATVAAIVAVSAYFYLTYAAQERAQRLANPAYVAVDALMKQVKANPGNAELHSRLAEALATAGELDQAKAELLAAIKLDENYIGAYQNLATIELEQKLYAESKIHWQKVLDLTADTQMKEINDRREFAYFNLGQIAYIEKDWESAVTYFTAALRIRKDASDTYLLLARSYMELGANEMAFEKIQGALAFDTSYAEAYYVRGLLFRDAGDIVNAAWDFRAALDLAPDNPEAQAAVDSLGSFESWYSKATTAWASKDASAALDAVRVARSITPSDYGAAMLHGAILEYTGDDSGAADAYAIALKAKPNDPTAAAALKRAQAASKE